MKFKKKIFNLFSPGDDETDNEPAEDPLSSTNRHNRGSVVCLKKRDIPLYGFCPEVDPFAIVTCRKCQMVLKASALKRHIDLRHEPVVKIEKMSVEKISGAVEKISVITDRTDSKRHRHSQAKTSPIKLENIDIEIEAPVVLPKVVTPPPVAPAVPSKESSSSSNSPEPPRKRRKQQLEPVVTQEPTFQTITNPPCRIMMSSSSPPPLAPITHDPIAQEPPPPSVWIVTPTVTPAVIIDGSFVVKSLEAEIETEVDLKDLKVLKPVVKAEPPTEVQTQLTSSNWYAATQPRPLILNTFNMRKLNSQRYVMATQRKLIELGRTLRQDEKITTTVTKAQPKTWSFIERNQVFIRA